MEGEVGAEEDQEGVVEEGVVDQEVDSEVSNINIDIMFNK